MPTYPVVFPIVLARLQNSAKCEQVNWEPEHEEQVFGDNKNHAMAVHEGSLPMSSFTRSCKHVISENVRGFEQVTL